MSVAVLVAMGLLLSAAAGRAEEAPIATTQPTNKMIGLQERIDAWLAAGGDAADVLPLGQKLDQLLRTGTPQEVDAQIDLIRAITATPPSGAKRSAAQAAATPIHIDVRPIPAGAAIIYWAVRADATHQGPTFGPSELYTMNVDGGGVTPITVNNPRMYEHAAVSFDHKRIASDRYLGRGSGPTGIWVTDIDAKTEQRLLIDFFTAGDGGVDWSPDGFIYFAGRRATNERAGVFHVRPDGSSLSQLVALDASDPGFVGDVSLSEDGSLLAYVRAVHVTTTATEATKTQIWVARVDGSGQRMVDDGGSTLGMYGGFPIGDFDPELSSDNKFVVFSRTNPRFVNFRDTVNTAHDLWIAALDGSSPARRLTQPGPVSIIPDWRDGKILYTEYDERGQYIGLVTVAPDGGGKRRLESHPSALWDGGRHGKWIPR